MPRILAWGQCNFHDFVNDKVGNKTWDGPLLTNTNFYDEFGPKIAIIAKSHLGVCKKGVNGRNKFLWYILQWEAAPKNWAIDWMERRLQMKKRLKLRVYGIRARDLRSVTRWQFGQCNLGLDRNRLGSHTHLPRVLHNRQRKTSANSLDTMLTKLIHLWFSCWSVHRLSSTIKHGSKDDLWSQL